MAYTMDNKKFAGKITSIKATTGKMRDLVQDALVAATYLCLKNSGGTTPFQQVLDAVGTAAHRQGIVRWAETFAPVMLRDEKLVLNKAAYSEMDKDGILADFDAFIAESGMDEVKWYEIAKSTNTSVSVFDLDKTLDNFCKKLEKNELAGLAAALRKAEQDYFANAIRNEMQVPA